MPLHARGRECHCGCSGDFESCWIRVAEEWCAYIILCGLSLKIRSQYDNCRACATEQSLTNFRIMTARQIIYSSTIILLGFFQALPALLCLASTNIPVILLGIIWGVLLGKFWSSTIIGKWYFRELWRATLRLENLMFPEVWESWQVRKFCLETFG